MLEGDDVCGRVVGPDPIGAVAKGHSDDPMQAVASGPEGLHLRPTRRKHGRLDVAFKEDISRHRAGAGAGDMPVMARFALGLGRASKVKRRVKSGSKQAGWSTNIPLEILRRQKREPGFPAV